MSNLLGPASPLFVMLPVLPVGTIGRPIWDIKGYQIAPKIPESDILSLEQLMCTCLR